MIWYNYLASSVDTSLNTNSLCTSEKLSEYIAKNTETLYHCYYNLEKRDTFVGYQGLLNPVFDSIYIDLDDDETKGDLAFADAKNMCQDFKENNIDFTLYFSGNKGFHIAIHKDNFEELASPLPKEDMEKFVKTFLFGLKEKYKTVDTRIWNANRKFRAAGSRHEKSGLYKTLIYPGNKVTSMTLAEVRHLSSVSYKREMQHPKCNLGPCPQILKDIVALGTGLVGNTTYSGKKSETKEVPQGQMIDDQSMKYRTLKDKPCISGMLESRNPAFNRHDIGLRIITDLHATGHTLSDAESKFSSWSHQTYGSDTQRITDSIRMLNDTFQKPQDYRYGCYDEIKQAYCSAKCKIYKALDPKKRAQPLDVTVKQSNENLIRENPNLELSEGELADSLIKELGDVCRASGDYFRWVKTHWERVDRDRFESMINQYSIAAYKNQAPTKKVKSLVDHIKMKIQVAPENNHFFNCSPNKFNFTDGTAHVTAIDGKLHLELKPHEPSDMLASCHNFPLYAEHNLPKASNEWEQYLKLRLEDVGADGVRIIKQMLGAALIPYVPRIFFIEGITNSGKSTLAQLIKKLLGPGNVSEVLPVLKNGGGDRFNWEPAVGKIANIVLELPKNVELDVNTLKMVRDKTLVSVDRKREKHVQATLPFFHLYCCNTMPNSYEGNSGALNNRITMLKFKPGYMNGRGSIVEYAEHIWALDAGSVLEYAREGLADLMGSGFRYFESADSKKAVSEWQEITDTVTTYFSDLMSGEWKKPAELEGKEYELGSILYGDFKKWAADSGRKATGKQGFFKELEVKMKMEKMERAKNGTRFKVPAWFLDSEMRPNGNATKMRHDLSIGNQVEF